MTMILDNSTITSNTLMSNQPCRVSILPTSGNGIIFNFAGERVKADASNVVSTQNCTVIGNEKIKIALIEHFMAAVAINNIDSLDVSVTNYELPILDGSAKEWVDFFDKNNLKNEITPKYELIEPVYYSKDNTTIVVLPSDSFSVTYCVDFHNGELENRWACFDGNNIKEIAEARTFGYFKDLEKLQAMGLAQGVSLENTVGLLEKGYTTELRSDFEPIKHKILDLLGDFRLTGFNPLCLKAQVIAKNAGHASHCEVAKILKNKIVEIK